MGTRQSKTRRAPARAANSAAVAATAAARKAALVAESGVARRSAEPADMTPSYPIGKARSARKGISIYMHPLAKDTLDRISRDHRKTVQDLGLEALNLLFRKYGEKPIA